MARQLIVQPHFLSSSRTPLLGSSPLRTGRETFASSGSSTSNASLKETRFGHRKPLAMNPVMAPWMKQNAVLGTGRTTLYERDEMVKSPTRGTGDFGIAHRAEAVLFHPEKAQNTTAPKRIQHMSLLALFEVGLTGRVIGVRVASNLDMSFDGSPTSEQKPIFMRLSLAVVIPVADKGPTSALILFKVFRFDPAQGLVWMPPSCPFPYTREDVVIHAIERLFTRRVPMIIGPTSYHGVEFLN